MSTGAGEQAPPARGRFEKASVRDADVDGRMVKAVAWYDNEWGYSNRCVELAAKVLQPVAAGAG